MSYGNYLTRDLSQKGAFTALAVLTIFFVSLSTLFMAGMVDMVNTTKQIAQTSDAIPAALGFIKTPDIKEVSHMEPLEVEYYNDFVEIDTFDEETNSTSEYQEIIVMTIDESGVKHFHNEFIEVA